LIIALAGLVVRGLNYSIDFTGGTLIQYENRSGATVEEIRDVLAQDPYNRRDAEIQVVGTDQVQIRTTALTDLSAEERTQLIEELARQADVTPDDLSTQVVGPTWGEEISRQALIGLVVVLLVITLYITLRFEWKMAIGAMVAMVHDVVITAGVYALTGRQVSPGTVIAILTILGFSLYDTVVIYDKVKENTESPALLAKSTYEEVANLSMNQVLMRSVNTSLVVVLPIATPLLVVLKERESRFKQHRARLEARPGERRLRPVPGTAVEDEVVAEESAAGGGRRRGLNTSDVTELPGKSAPGFQEPA